MDEEQMRYNHYSMACVLCTDHREDPSLNTLDWFAVVKDCISCLGTNKELIPMAEVIVNLRCGNRRR